MKNESPYQPWGHTASKCRVQPPHRVRPASEAQHSGRRAPAASKTEMKLEFTERRSRHCRPEAHGSSLGDLVMARV